MGRGWLFKGFEGPATGGFTQGLQLLLHQLHLPRLRNGKPAVGIGQRTAGLQLLAEETQVCLRGWLKQAGAATKGRRHNNCTWGRLHGGLHKVSLAMDGANLKHSTHHCRPAIRLNWAKLGAR